MTLLSFRERPKIPGIRRMHVGHLELSSSRTIHSLVDFDNPYQVSGSSGVVSLIGNFGDLP